MSNIKIIIATHKKYKMPEDLMYIPVQVGAEGKDDLGYTRDNSGENISNKNNSFCELTGLYWAWKNLNTDYIGLVHYRRHFSYQNKGINPFENVLNSEELNSVFQKYRIVVPKKRKYYIESLYTHYAHTHYAQHLDITKDIIEEMYPNYTDIYDKVINRTYGYMFNMMIMPKQLMNDYCEWLFSILFELEKRIGTPNLSAFQGRFYGRVSEIIFNIWLEKKIVDGEIKNSEVYEMKCIYMEKINKMKKVISFMKAKFFHKKYESSF